MMISLIYIAESTKIFMQLSDNILKNIVFADILHLTFSFK